MKVTRTDIIFGSTMLMIAVGAGLVLSTRIDSPAAGIELGKADCIETCVKVLQTQSVFPDYHRTVQKCNDAFAEVEACQLAPKGDK